MMENRSMRVYCYVLVALFAFFLPSAVYAQSEISVDVEMDEYSLGDHIVFTLSVSDILNESATLIISHNLQTVIFCRNFGNQCKSANRTYTVPDPVATIFHHCQVIWYGGCKY